MVEVENSNKTNTTRFMNPFVVESPEKLTPQQIAELFIEKFTKIEVIKQRRHTFIWGSRGSGKSMMLKYLEPSCQSIVHGNIEKFLNQKESFLSIYCPCKEGHLNKTEIELLNDYAKKIITEHLLNLSIAERLINSLRTQFPPQFFGIKKCIELSENILTLFDIASIATSLEQTSKSISMQESPLQFLQELFIKEREKINYYLKNNALVEEGVSYEGATSGYHDFLLPFIKCVQKLPKLASVPIYLLIDDADKLTEPQQSILNTWIANRDQAFLCIKISARREDYKTLLTRDGGLIEQPHDYSEIDVDELYTRSKNDYYNKTKLISEKRLELSNLTTKDIEKFLPPDSRQEKLLEEIKIKTALEWEKANKPGRQEDYINRYSKARLFQHLKATKQQRNYAGFKNLVHISSGVIRDFLEPCYLMFDRCLSLGQEATNIKSIPPNIQNETIFNYSEEFRLQKFDDIRKSLPPEKWSGVDKLTTLIESLGRLFYNRLHDPKSRDARLFSFTVKDFIPKEIQKVLRLGVRYRYFQLRTYSTKEGGGREEWYILNRRLCPVYKLDPTGFEGRISLNSKMLELACNNPHQFVRDRLKMTEENQPTLEFFNMEENNEEIRD